MLRGGFQFGTMPIGLDLGASGAKAIQLQRVGGRFKVRAATRVEADCDDPNDEGYYASLGVVLKRKLQSGEFQGRACVIGLDDRLLRVRSVRLPSMPDAETDQSLRVDAAHRLGFEASERVEVGWLRAGAVQQGDESREEIILAGVRSQAVERIVDAVIDAGLEPIGVEPGFAATARCFGRRRRRAVDQQVAQIVVDIGRRSTSVLAMRGETLCFYKQIDWGGERLDRAAAERLDMDAATVAEIRRQRLKRVWTGRDAEAPVDDHVDRAIFDAIRPLLNELAHEINLCVRYFLVTFRGSKPDGIVLVGGDAPEPRLSEIVGEVCGLPTTLGRPLEGIELAPTTFTMNRRGPLCEWATASGLSLRAEHRADAARDVVERVKGLFTKRPGAGRAA